MTTERLDRSARLPLLWAAPFLVLAFSAWPSASQQSSRGVERIAVETGSFDPESSAGLFVGIREFTGDSSLAEVPFAVDDAVDLAHLFSIELGLVSPKRVHVLISGRPEKTASKDRLEELKDADAGISEGKATNSDIFRQVKKLSELAGADGLLVVSFATHGVSVGGQHYLMAGESLRGYRETGVATATVFEDLDGSAATRRLVLLDACRERLEREW